MNYSNDAEKPNVNRVSSKGNKGIGLLFGILREILALIFWGYVIIKLFIFDIDIYLIEKYFQDYRWVINYKFFILVGILAVIWSISKNKQILLWSLYILFYPVIVFLWKIPLFIFKQKSWNLAFAYGDLMISFFKSLRITFITMSFFLVSTAVILVSSNRTFLWLSIAILAIILLFVYLQRFILSVRPSGIYQVYERLFLHFGEFLQNYKSPLGALDENELRLPLERLEEKQIRLWVSEVQQLVLFNRVCLFVARKLKSYQDSGFNIVTSVIGILLLVLYTIFSFAVINFGLYKIDPHSFSYPVMPSFFRFIYYSFNALVFNQIQEVIAIGTAAQIALMVEYFCAFFIAAIFVSLVLSVRQQKSVDELNETVKNLSQVGERVEGFIKEKYRLENIDVAMDALAKLRASFIGFLYDITKALE